MEIVALLSFVVIGVLAGLIGGLLGLSGGIVTVPCLVLLFRLMGIPQTYLMHIAIGTSLAAMVLNSLASMWAHHRRQGVVWKIVFAMIPGIFLGCMLGSFVAQFLSSVVLQVVFGSFICFLGAYILLQKRKRQEKKLPDKTLYTWLGFGIGTLSSLLGVGGGVFSVPLLISYRYPEKQAVGTSAAMGLFITFVAAVAYLYFGLKEVKLPLTLGFIYLPAFAVIGFVAIFFAPLGAKLAHRIKGALLRKIFAGTLIIVGILMIFN
ncbi:MAG: hypothetical protein K1000chlam2_00230 [Chlamydiae bacterium]|nr:hypothetical protein [Chlamydiota bacterium]